MSDDSRFANRPGKSEVVRILAPWVAATCCHHCAETEARIDSLLATLSEQSREMADLAGHDVFIRATLASSLATIERQQREIVRLQAEIARMRTDPARRPTRTESIVRALQPWYAPEGE